MIDYLFGIKTEAEKRDQTISSTHHESQLIIRLFEFITKI
jgi:hypothetical protein